MSGASRAPRQRRPRSVRASLGSIVLAIEFVIVVLAALVLFGLRTLPASVALGGGAAVLVLIVAALGLLRSTVGIVLGWIVQVVLLVAGRIDLAVGIVAGIFVAMWVYAMIAGRRIDRREAGA